MNISEVCIRRPVMTTLITASIIVFGIFGYRLLAVAALPRVDFPTIQVTATLPGASPETMASAVATPLERQFGRIAGINQMTSSSSLGSTNISLQFDLNRNVDAAARDVQAAINAAAPDLPAELALFPPQYFKADTTTIPVLLIAMTSTSMSADKLYDLADTLMRPTVMSSRVVPGPAVIDCQRIPISCSSCSSSAPPAISRVSSFREISSLAKSPKL